MSKRTPTETQTVAMSLQEIQTLGTGFHLEGCTGTIYTVDANHRGRLVLSYVFEGNIHVANLTHKEASRFLVVEGPSKQPDNITTTADSTAPDAQPEPAQSIPDTITQTKSYKALDALLAFQVEDSASAVADVLADLMYWSHAHGVDFEDSLERATGYYAIHI